jgi:hypothetical protein
MRFKLNGALPLHEIPFAPQVHGFSTSGDGHTHVIYEIDASAKINLTLKNGQFLLKVISYSIIDAIKKNILNQF